MAAELQRPDTSSGGSSRLEVSIDGLTLSPDSEGEQEQVDRLNPLVHRDENEVQSKAHCSDGEEVESAKTMERKWGFSLQELYGLAVKFFKGMMRACNKPVSFNKLTFLNL
ncbi:hypothetical protein GN956_G16210 [Arapaima gigas]